MVLGVLLCYSILTQLYAQDCSFSKMLNPAQLNRCNENWTVSLIVIICCLVPTSIAVLFRGLTIRADAREARRVRNPHNGSRSLLWSDRILFLSLVSTFKLEHTAFTGL